MEQLPGQMSIYDFVPDPEKKKPKKTDFSCFKSYKDNRTGAVKLAKCPHDGVMKYRKSGSQDCETCESHIEFYEVVNKHRAETGCSFKDAVTYARMTLGIDRRQG